MHHLVGVAPIILVNPRNDPAFREAAEAAVAAGAETAHELQRTLRGKYPRVTVHQRELSGELSRVWYVYRDGRWVGSADRR
jgi:hypothetical protein